MRSPLPENSSKIVFTLHKRSSGEQQGSYDRSCSDRYEWPSVDEARRDNCHGVFEDEEQWQVKKWRVTYELIDEDA